MTTVRCDFCDMPLEQCIHSGPRTRPEPRRTTLEKLDVSPAGFAHIPGCMHKGDDPDFSQWGAITRDASAAWQELGNGRSVPCDDGKRPDLVARRRCRTCEDSL